MIFFLELIVSFFTNFGQWLLYAIELVWNALMDAIEILVEGVLGALPGLPEHPGPPMWLAWLNWFFPVGAVVSIATTMLSAFSLFFSVRWILKKAGIV